MNSANCRSESIRFSSSSKVENRRATSAIGNPLPITANVCSRSFSSAGSRSIRAARISVHRGRNLELVEGTGKCHRAVADQRAFIEQHQHHLFDKERIAFGTFDDEPFEAFDAVLHPHPSGDLKVPGRPLPACAWRLRRRRGRGTQKNGEHFVSPLL